MKSRYAEYKESGIEWIGLIPSHWEVVKSGNHIHIQSGYPFKSELFDSAEGFPILRIRDITSGHCETFYKGEYSTDYVVNNGDLLVGMDGDFTERIWRGGAALLNQRCCRIVPKIHLSQRFFYYFLPRVLKIINDLTYYTTVKHLSNDDLREIRIPLPPLSEQEAIVSYLDEKTSQIDSLLSLTEKKIELLKEKRTALINHAVTKGLHPDAPMKDSGIEWIGEIPRHWDCLPLRYLFRKIGSGLTPRGGSEVYVDEGVVFLRSQNVHFDGLRLEEVVKISLEVHESMLGTKVMKGDVLLNITGGSIGRCCLVKEDIEMNVNQHVCIIRVKNHLLPQFLNYFLKSSSGQLQVDLNITGGNREGLSSENIKNFIIPICKISEQEAIVSYLDEKTSQIDSLIAIEQKRIDTLKEYRQSLISEVVTGKIKVCEEVNSIAV